MPLIPALCCLLAGMLGPLRAQQPPARLALLVGVETYAPGTPDSVPALQGCRADVLAVRETLIGQFGFAAEDVHVLLDEQATHEAIVRAWREWLIPRAGPETEVVFWFSGHGARIPDASGRKDAERGQTDNTILAYDSRAHGEDGSYDISDDELYSLHALLAQKTGRLFAVIDACHSASGMRGLPHGALARVRAAGDGTQPLALARLAAFWPGLEHEFVDDGPARGAGTLPGATIAACRENQEALEYQWIDEGQVRRTRGALSFFLSDALAHARPGETYRKLADDAAARLMRAVPGQTPCYEGDLDRRLFEGRFEEAPRGILASVQADQRLALGAGSLVGLVKGSELRLENASGALVGRARVESVWATRALARWIEAPRGDVQGALRAFEESRPAGGAVFPLYVDDPRLAAALPARAGVERIDAPRADGYLLQHDGDALKLFAPGGILFWSRHGLADAGPERLAQTLDEEWRKETRHCALEQLSRGTLALSARFVDPTPEELAKFKGKAVNAEPRKLAGVAGEVYGALGSADPAQLRLAILEVRNESDCKDDLFLSVLSVMESREQHLICPEAGTDVLLSPHTPQRVLVGVCTAPDWPLARPVRDRYVVIATRERSDFRPFENEPTLRGSDEGPLTMPPILAVGIAQLRTRGIERASTSTEGYGLTTVDLLVRKP